MMQSNLPGKFLRDMENPRSGKENSLVKNQAVLNEDCVDFFGQLSRFLMMQSNLPGKFLRDMENPRSGKENSLVKNQAVLNEIGSILFLVGVR